MSRGSGDVIGGAAVPLVDALPWESALSGSSNGDSKRTFLINDAIGTDGRFLLYTLASQVLSSSTGSNNSTGNNSTTSKRGRVLWLGCGPVTEGQILQGLKKIGCDKTTLSQATTGTGSNSTPDANSSLLTIRSLTTEISNNLLGSDATTTTTSTTNEESTAFDAHEYVKTLYHYIIDTWLLPNSGEEDGVQNQWIVLDDVSALADLLGEKLVYGLVLALNVHASSTTTSEFGVVVRCSNDHEAVSLPSFAGSSIASSATEWFGAGGNSGHTATTAIPWERSLLEIADGVFDVLPLTSGYTRELHGRIVMTQMPHGRGWGIDRSKSSSTTSSARRITNKQQKQQPPMQIINYCITDQKIVAYII